MAILQRNLKTAVSVLVVTSVSMFVAACQTTSSTTSAADSSAAGAPDGMAIYTQHCAQCHGAQGQGMPEIDSPAIGGRSTFVINSLLKSYRSGKRGSDPANVPAAQMRAAALAISPEQSKVVSKFVSTMKKTN